MISDEGSILNKAKQNIKTNSSILRGLNNDNDNDNNINNNSQTIKGRIEDGTIKEDDPDEIKGIIYTHERNDTSSPLKTNKDISNNQNQNTNNLGYSSNSPADHKKKHIKCLDFIDEYSDSILFTFYLISFLVVSLSQIDIYTNNQINSTIKQVLGFNTPAK